MCHDKSLFNAEVYARADDVIISVSEPDPENFFSFRALDCASITTLSFGPLAQGTITTLVLARACKLRVRYITLDEYPVTNENQRSK
jgi:hypothetical protein